MIFPAAVLEQALPLQRGLSLAGDARELHFLFQAVALDAVPLPLAGQLQRELIGKFPVTDPQRAGFPVHGYLQLRVIYHPDGDVVRGELRVAQVIYPALHGNGIAQAVAGDVFQEPEHLQEI